MHLIPNHLAPIAAFTDRNAAHRFALQAVELRTHADNTFIAQASDTRRLIRVTGPCSDRNAFPDSKAVADSPNGEDHSLIPAKVWETAFSKGRKLGQKQRVNLEARENIAVIQGEKVTTFVATDLDSEMVERTKHVDGKLPDLASIIPSAGRQNFEFTVDPVLLADTLAQFAKLRDTANAGLQIEVHSGKLVLRDTTAKGLTATALICTFSESKKPTEELDEPEPVVEIPVAPAGGFLVEPDLSALRIEIGCEVQQGPNLAITRLSKNQYKLVQNGWTKYLTHAAAE